MGSASSKIFQLRPVTFFYKPQYDDGSHILQYGLIAEEVAKIYPDLVVYGTDGQPQAVRYHLLTPMLLNELQKQQKAVTAQQDVIQAQQQEIQSLQQGKEAQQQQIRNLQSQNAEFEQRLQTQNAEFQQRLSRLESLITSK
jgi:trimeric autotransporter adhesin